MEVKYPDVTVPLSQLDGNVFVLIGATAKALKRAGYREAATEFTTEAMSQKSYDDVIQLIMRTVETE